MVDNSNQCTQQRRIQTTKQTHSQLTHVTHYSCIFVVTTIVHSNASMGAVSQACLTPSAAHIIIVDGTTALTKVGISTCTCGSAVPELTACHVGISQVPAIMTHSAPFSVMVDLHTPLIVSGTSNQSEVTLCGRRETTAVYKIEQLTWHENISKVLRSLYNRESSIGFCMEVNITGLPQAG